MWKLSFRFEFSQFERSELSAEIIDGAQLVVSGCFEFRTLTLDAKIQIDLTTTQLKLSFVESRLFPLCIYILLFFTIMDCTIPSHNVRTFCSAIASMSKIGKDLYVEFDPLDGLNLRTLNDSKSAFCAFYWKPAFFERCTAPPLRKRSQEDQVYKCRIPMRAMAAITKPRKGVVSLRIQNESSSDHLYLSFAFQLEKNNIQLCLLHRLGVADADGVSAVADRKDASEIVALPRFLLRMMEPLKKATEVALIVNDKAKIVTMASFHHEAQHGHDNAILQTKSATLLKTETSVGADEFEEFFFQDHDQDNDAADGDTPPHNVKQEVTLVCSLREPKAMLQFCASAVEEDLRVTLSFHWGGKPIVFGTKTPTFSGELVMATLDHKLLRHAANNGGGGGQQQQQ